jgi:hypothetical protein
MFYFLWLLLAWLLYDYIKGLSEFKEGGNEMKEFKVALHYEGVFGLRAYVFTVPAADLSGANRALRDELNKNKFVETDKGLVPTSRIVEIFVEEAGE